MLVVNCRLRCFVEQEKYLSFFPGRGYLFGLRRFLVLPSLYSIAVRNFGALVSLICPFFFSVPSMM